SPIRARRLRCYAQLMFLQPCARAQPLALSVCRMCCGRCCRSKFCVPLNFGRLSVRADCKRERFGGQNFRLSFVGAPTQPPAKLSLMHSLDIVAHAPLDRLIATGNAGKLREFAQLLTGLPLRLRGLTEFPFVAEVAETGATFAENALLKARGYCEQTRLWTLADDSGLEVAALDGAPGVFSARYAGPDATDETRRARLL